MSHSFNHDAGMRHAGYITLGLAIILELAWLASGFANALAGVFDSLPPGATLEGAATLWADVLEPAQISNLAITLIAALGLPLLEIGKIPLCYAILFRGGLIEKSAFTTFLLFIALITFLNFVRIVERGIAFQQHEVVEAREQRLVIRQTLDETKRLLAENAALTGNAAEVRADFGVADRDISARQNRDLAALARRHEDAESALWERAPMDESAELRMVGSDLKTLEAAHRARIVDLDGWLETQLGLVRDQRAADHAATERWRDARHEALGLTDVGQYQVQVATLNVRAGPGQEFETITSLKRNQVVNISDFSGAWGRIDGEAQFVHSAYVAPAGARGQDTVAIEGLLNEYDVKRAGTNRKHDERGAELRTRHRTDQQAELAAYATARERLVDRQDALRAARDATVADRDTQLAALAREIRADAATVMATARAERAEAAAMRDAGLTALQTRDAEQIAMRDQIAALEQTLIEKGQEIGRLTAQNSFTRFARQVFGHEDAGDVSEEELALITGLWAIAQAAIQALAPIGLTFAALRLLYGRSSAHRRRGVIGLTFSAVRRFLVTRRRQSLNAEIAASKKVYRVWVPEEEKS